jgi:hypothetical protein
MEAGILFLSVLLLLPYVLAEDARPRAGGLPAGCEFVMSPGMRITATTPRGTIGIIAVDELTRSYTWDGATRSVMMSPRAARWYGSLGLFNPGAGEHWRDHRGITCCVTEEGRQHFKTVEEAMKWIKERDYEPFVYRDDGLMVGWDKILPRKQLGVEVWQIFIDGKKPRRLPGNQDDKIVVETVETETVPLVKAVANNDLRRITALLADGAGPNVKNSAGVPVLVMAIRLGSAHTVEALLKNKADPNVRDADTDSTPLLEALGSADIVKALLAAGADVNAASSKEGNLLKGWTPLMVAAIEGPEDIIQLLLDNGADLNATTPNGDTALSMAKWNQSNEHKGVIRKIEAAMTKK